MIGQEEMKAQVRDLWRLCFPADSEEFVDLYFRMRYTEQINSAVVEDGKVIAALQRIPYPMTFAGDVVPTAYISGACTHPDFRGKGVMRSLLAEAHRQMYREGVVLSTLIPAEESLRLYYDRSGYALCFQQDEKLLTGKCLFVDKYSSLLRFSEIDSDKFLSDEVWDFFYEQQRKRPCALLHTREDMQAVLSDWIMSGGQVWAAFSAETPVGVAFCLGTGEDLQVRELLASDPQAENQLEVFLLRHYGADRLLRRFPSGGNGEFRGMARVIRVQSLLALWSRLHPQPLNIRVTGDDTFPENNGDFRVEEGSCCRIQAVTPNVDRVYDIRQLPAFLFAGQYPFMNLMMD